LGQWVEIFMGVILYLSLLCAILQEELEEDERTSLCT
jgi:hypothetical protein